MEMRRCTKCGSLNKITTYRIRKDSPSKIRRRECNGCLKDYAKKDYRKNKEARDKYAKDRARNNPDMVRNQKYKRDYGITLKEYSAILLSQGGKCKICGTTKATGSHKHLVVDHCHETKKVRGILCGICNAGLGLFKDNRLLIRKALRYLNESL